MTHLELYSEKKNGRIAEARSARKSSDRPHLAHFSRRIISRSVADNFANSPFASPLLFRCFVQALRCACYRRGWRKGWWWTTLPLARCYPRDLKGRTKIRAPSTAWRGNGWRVEGGREKASSQFLSYIWEFRRIGFCLTYAQWPARILALSRMAIFSSRPSESSIRIPDFVWIFQTPPLRDLFFPFLFFIPITLNHRDAGNGESYSRDAKFRVRNARGFPAICEESTKI